MKKILITGASGASGTALIEKLRTEDSNNNLSLCDIQNPNGQNNEEKFYELDLTDFSQVDSLIKKIQPEVIYNLAGSFTNNYEIDYKINVEIPRNLFDSVIINNLSTRILLIGSAAEYGEILKNPVSESDPLRPITVYGLTKVYQTQMMNYYFKVKKIDVLMARPFNLLSKGISKNLFIGRLYNQIELYQRGKIQKIQLGNLANKRDYISIHEAVEMYRCIMDKGKSGEVYNVGSGKSIRMQELLIDILNSKGLTMDIIESKKFSSKFDVEEIYADLNKYNSL